MINSNNDVCTSILWAISALPERQICKMCMKDNTLLEIIVKIFKESKNANFRLPSLRLLGNI